MLLTRLRVRAARDDGAAMVAVIGVMAIGLLVTSLVLTSVVSTIGVTSSTQAGVQSQAAAEAGIAAARAGLAAGTCGTVGVPPTYRSATGTSPNYAATIWRPAAGGGWVAGCPVGTATQVRIVSTGYADNPGVGGISAADSTSLEAILGAIATVTPPPPSISPSGPVVYAYSSNGFGGGGTLYSVDGSSPDVMVKTGNVTCDGGASGVDDLIVDGGTLRIDGGCSINGTAWSTGRTTLSGGATIAGNVVAAGITHGGTLIGGSVWSTADVTINGGGRIGGTATGQSMSLTNGRLGGNGWIYGQTTLNWGGYLDGNLTTRTISKPNNSGYDSQYVRGTITLVPGGLGSSAFSTAPTRPTVPGWYNFAYNASVWTGFTERVMSGSCTYSTLNTVVASFAGSPGLIDARGCTSGIVINGSDEVAMTADVAIVANRFSLTNGGGFRSTTASRLWLITPDSNTGNTVPNCPSGGSFTISGDFDFSNTISTMIYTPCAVTIGSGIDTLRGQVWAGSADIDGGANFGYVPVGLPGVNLNTGSTATPTATPVPASTSRELISLRNVQE